MLTNIKKKIPEAEVEDLNIFQQDLKPIKLIQNNATAKPAQGKRWIIMGGTVKHINLTDTNLFVSGLDAPTDLTALASFASSCHILRRYIASATATGIYNLFGTDAATTTPQHTGLLIIGNTQNIILFGGTDVEALIWVLEYDEK